MVTPLSVILEAKGKKKNEISPTEGEDYTKDELEEEEETSEENETTEVEPDATDYTAEDPEDGEEEVNDEPDTTEESEDELTPTDYTAEDPDSGEDETPEDDTEGGSDEDEQTEPTDYTSEDPEEGGEETSEDNTETGSEDTSTVSSDGGALNEEDEKRKKKELFYDFIELYDLIKSFISKLSSQGNNTIFVNKILIQINKNLNDSRRAIWNFIIYEFDKNNYVTNLTKYNFFVENIRINIEMVHKVKDYLSKSETFK